MIRRGNATPPAFLAYARSKKAGNRAPLRTNAVKRGLLLLLPDYLPLDKVPDEDVRAALRYIKALAAHELGKGARA